MAANWDDMKVALAIGRAGSLTRAAEALGIDQSTCGRRLAALEAAFGTLLFLRSKSGLTATEAGEAAIARAIEVERRMDRLADDLARGPDGPAGVVRLVGSAWTLELLARRAAARLLAAHPKLDLRMATSHPRNPARLEPTLSLWFEANPRDAEFAIRLVDVPYAVYGVAGVDPATLPWVSLHDEDAPRLAPVRALERLRKRDERLRLTSGDVGALAGAIEAGVGRGLLPVCVGKGLPGVARLTEGPPDLVAPLHLHMHPDTVQTHRVQAVIRWLRESAESVFDAAP